MRFKSLLSLTFLSCGMLVSSAVWAQTVPVSTGAGDDNTKGGFARPYEYERQAYGYDPEGIEYKENLPEDFQVVFISSAPFAALASLGLTKLASTLFPDAFTKDSDVILPLIGGTVLGATAVASISVLTNKYPPPPASSIFYAETPVSLPPLAFKITVLSASF